MEGERIHSIRTNIFICCTTLSLYLPSLSISSWYDESQLTVFDSGTDGETSWSGKIIGVAESNNDKSTDPIVVKLESGGGSDW